VVAENVDLDFMERSAPFGAENQGLGIVEGSAPSKTEEKHTSSVSVRRARYVGALATPGDMALRRKEKKRRKPLDDGENLDKLGLIREPLETSGLKEGTVEAPRE
jgi:hypothetical protein